MSAGVRREAVLAEKATDEEFLFEVVRGLSQPQKTLPSRYFYDERGSELFERITELPEYYPTRTEIELLSAHGPEIARAVPAATAVVEFGSGSSRKTELLLKALKDPVAYIPIEISRAALYPAAERISKRFPGVAVHPILGGFHNLDRLRLPSGCPSVIGFFPGSTIGNFDPMEAARFFMAARSLLGPDSCFLVGADLLKPLDILLPAYNDACGITAAFNLNVLARINRELAATFDLNVFEHEAIFNPREGRIEMHLRAKTPTRARVRGHSFSFAAGETIHTENSYKYDLAGFSLLAAAGGWRVVQTWTDQNKLFSITLLADPRAERRGGKQWAAKPFPKSCAVRRSLWTQVLLRERFQSAS